VGHSAPRHSVPAPVAERAFNATGRSAMATIQPHCLETLYRFPLLTQRRLVARFMISAYHDVDLKAGAERVASTKFRDTEPEFYAAEWLYKAGKYALWRLIGASAR
jgi:hypothetical protein